MEETQSINIGSGQDLSAIANQQKKVSFDSPANNIEMPTINIDDADPLIQPQNYDNPEM